jgi:hypothetical protein
MEVDRPPASRLSSHSSRLRVACSCPFVERVPLDNTPRSPDHPPDMDSTSNLLDRNSGLLLVLLAGVAIYVSVRAGIDAVMAGRPVTGGRLAVGYWLPIGVMAIWAAATDGSINTEHGEIANYHGAVAMGIVFGTAVGGLLLAAGAAVLISPPKVMPGGRLLWPLLVPVGFLAMFAGFKGSLDMWAAIALSAEGVIILAAVRPLFFPPLPVVNATDDSPAPPRMPGLRVIQFILAVLVAGVAAYFGLRGVDSIVIETGRATPGLLTTILVCPLLVLPSVGRATDLAQHGKSGEVIEAAIWQAVGNICFLAPLLLVTTRIAYIARHWATAKSDYGVGNPIPFPAMPFPVTVWRVDVLFVIAAGLLLLPVATGRWPLSKRQGLGMTIAYGFYLFLPIYWLRATH